mgnify:FL=1
MNHTHNLGYSFNSGGFNNRSGMNQYKPYKAQKTNDANLFKVKKELILEEDLETDDRDVIGDIVSDQVGNISLSMNRSTAPPKQRVGYDDTVVKKIRVDTIESN